MPQRHLMRCRAVLLLVTTIYVLINQSDSRAEFLPQLEIISYPASTGKPPVWEAMKVQRTVGRELPFAHHNHIPDPAPGAPANSFFRTSP